MVILNPKPPYIQRAKASLPASAWVWLVSESRYVISFAPERWRSAISDCFSVSSREPCLAKEVHRAAPQRWCLRTTAASWTNWETRARTF